jgi:hypothetical protein
LLVSRLSEDAAVKISTVFFHLVVLLCLALIQSHKHNRTL